MVGKITNLILRIPLFYGTGRDDAKQHWFTCDALWVMKQVTNEKEKITQMETPLRDHVLTRYMKYKSTIAQGAIRTLGEIK